MEKNLAADIISSVAYRDVFTGASNVQCLVKHFSNGTWPLLVCLVMIKQEPPAEGQQAKSRSTHQRQLHMDRKPAEQLGTGHSATQDKSLEDTGSFAGGFHA